MTNQHKMNQTVKEKWLQALRSKEYKQGSGCLKKEDKFCCLGVLTDLYIKENNLNWSLDDSSYVYEKLPVPGSVVRAWAGLEYANPDIKIDKPFPDSLAGMNDDGYSFEEIADVIEQQL
jgi:hypothetical protein